MKLLDKLQAAVVVIVAEHDEQSPKAIAVAATGNQEDLQQVFVREMRGKACDGLREGQGPEPGAGCARGRLDHQNRTRIVPAHLV